MIGEHDFDLSEARVGGTEVNYYFVCKKKLWLFSNGIQLEHTSDIVDSANFVHETAYPREMNRELLIDGLLRIDFDDQSGTIHEIKMSKSFHRAHFYQLVYYLYYLKKKGYNLKGTIHYPKLRRKEVVVLEDELEREIKEIVQKIRELKNSVICPDVKLHANCKKCSYEEFCWG